jgi:uncharacterized membrane protein/protein-disulfide isomerase
MHQEIKPLPFPFYFWSTVAIAFVGLADAVYLAVSHYRVYTDMGYKSFCAVSKSINCDTVSQSTSSIFLDVPVPVWGIVGYLFFLLLLLATRKTPSGENRLWPTLFILALCYSIYSIVLAVISMVYIRSYCIMCIATYAVNLTLLFYTWLIHRRFENLSMVESIKREFRWLLDQKKALCTCLCVAGGTALLLILYMPHYWELSSPPLNQELPSGMTEDGHPWIGALNPQLVITEFSDYQCFQCRKMHYYIRELVASHPGKLRLIHRNFPMDHAYNPMIKEPYHIGSGKMALLSLYAAQKGKFWKINDMLYHIDKQEGHFNIREMATAAGFDVIEFAASARDRSLRQKLRVDIRDGIQLGITATPGYLVNGMLFVGHIPPDIIRVLKD